MATDLFSTALINSMTRNFSVSDLMRTAETLKQSGQIQQVETLYGTWVQNNQDHPLLYAILFNYSVAQTDSGHLAEAQASLERALALNPDFIPAYINLGRIHERLGAVGTALIQWSKGIEKQAAVNGSAITYKTTALNQSARTLEAVGQDEPAENFLRQSLELDPHQREVIQHYVALRQRQCEWPVISAPERATPDQLRTGMSPLSAGAYTDDPLFHLAHACHYNKVDAVPPTRPFTEWPAALAQQGRLRIGYLSSDLREHAMGHLLAEVFRLHDRTAVETFAYYCGIPAQDSMQTKFRGEFDHWVDITMLDDQTAAQRMVRDGIQILVDLNGYTRDARLKLVALRPAPVIVNWLGYPGTMASPYHHYLVADEWIVPPEHETYFSEKVVRLPCYQPSNRERTIAPGTPTRRDAGLPENAMVYCCFNGAHKINRFTYDRWLTILSRVPDSVLWLLGGTEATNARLRAHATQRGIAPERIVFASKLANAHHLARYVLADLFLDTTPYGAHTTCSDALWMGVPVLTCSGRSFASRVGGSLVRSAGLPELVCTDLRDYVERAVAFGLDRRQLEPLRARLRAQRDTCALFDMPRLVRELEGLYQHMWQACLNGELPRPDLANLDAYLEVATQVDHETLEVQTLGDYEGWWRALLSQRQLTRPLNPDHRLVGPNGPASASL